MSYEERLKIEQNIPERDRRKPESDELREQYAELSEDDVQESYEREQDGLWNLNPS